MGITPPSGVRAVARTGRVCTKRPWCGAACIGAAFMLAAASVGPSAAQTPQPPVPATVPVQPPTPIIPAIPPISQPAATPLSLQDAVGIALAQNFQYRQAAIEVAIAQSQVQQALAQERVTVGGVASYTQSSAEPLPLEGTITIPGVGIINRPFFGLNTIGATFTNEYILGLNLRYPLYSGHALEDQVAVAKANLDSARAQLAATAEQTVLSVRQAYYGIQQALGLVVSAQRAVAASAENLRVARDKFRAGTAARFDVLQAEVQLAQAQQNLTQADTGVATAQQTLASVLALPLSTQSGTAPFSPHLPPPSGNLDTLVQEALERRPELVAARAAIASAQASIDLAAAGLRPTITITGGPEVVTNDPTSSDEVFWQGMIQLNQAILDGGLTKAKIAQARQQLASARVSEQQELQAVELDVRNAYLSLLNAAGVLRSAITGRASAEESLRVAQVRFRAGVGTQLDVVTAVQNLAAADNSVVQATYAYYLALAQLDRAVGVEVQVTQ
jgi:outer membrane protein